MRAGGPHLSRPPWSAVRPRERSKERGPESREHAAACERAQYVRTDGVDQGGAVKVDWTCEARHRPMVGAVRRFVREILPRKNSPGETPRLFDATTDHCTTLPPFVHSGDARRGRFCSSRMDCCVHCRRAMGVYYFRSSCCLLLLLSVPSPSVASLLCSPATPSTGSH
jgi:hypothetical protein